MPEYWEAREKLEELLTKAENNMYLDKKAFYQKFPHLKR